jgi:4-amino-4-deoxy-L-arabinose transferase-like glycosyltransferase
VLAKGPAAIILSGGAVFFWAAFTKRWRDALRCLHPVAIATFCLTALPWYIACAQRNPDFFRVFIIEHNFKRFLTPEFQHVQPFWYYIPVILVAFLPWTPAALISVTFELRRYLRGYRFSPSTVFFLCWSLFCLLFFSISRSKLPGYILPAVPAIGMLLTKSYVYMTSQQSRVFRWIEFGIGILVAALGIALVSISFDQSTISKEVLLSEGWVIAALGIANAFLGIRRRKVFLSCNLVSFCVVPVLILLGCFNLLSPHFMAQDPSGKTLAGEIVASRIPLDEIYVANMRRGQLFSLNFYLHHVMKQWNPAEQHEGFVLVQFNSCREDHEELRLACADRSAKMTPSGWFIYKLKRSD